MPTPPSDDPTQRLPLARLSSAEPDENVPYLIVLTGEAAGQVILLDRTTTIGRDDDIEIRLSDAGVSRIHARIVVRSVGVFLADLRSETGTRLNGQRIQEPVRLQDGDKISIGSTTLLKFTYDPRFKQEFRQALFTRAPRDPLTGAWKRLYLNEQLRREIAYSRRHLAPLALLLVDIDGFHHIKTTWGTTAGDALLLELARRFHHTVRVEDVFARFGEESFAVLCRNTTPAASLSLATRLRAIAAAKPFTFPTTPHAVTTTVTIGIGVFPYVPFLDDADLLTGADLLLATERALADAKRTGRVVVAADIPT